MRIRIGARYSEFGKKIMVTQVHLEMPLWTFNIKINLPNEIRASMHKLASNTKR